MHPQHSSWFSVKPKQYISPHKCYITYPVQGILNGPVTTDRFQQIAGSFPFRGQTGYQIGDFLFEITALKVGSSTEYLNKLSGMGKFCLALLNRCYLDFTLFYTAMPFNSMGSSSGLKALILLVFRSTCRWPITVRSWCSRAATRCTGFTPAAFRDIPSWNC